MSNFRREKIDFFLKLDYNIETRTAKEGLLPARTIETSIVLFR